MAEERPLSKLVPVLLAIITCDTAVVDPGTGKKSLIGISTVFSGLFPHSGR